MREEGLVKWFDNAKGYGFITRIGKPDVFVHFKAILGDGHKTLLEKQRVSFETSNGTKGLQAENVEIIS